MPRLKLWLLDVSQERRPDGRPEAWLWGLDERGRRVLVVDRSLSPFFYAIPRPPVGAASLKRILEANPQIKGAARAETAQARYFGRGVEAVKLSFRRLEDAEAAARMLPRLGEVESLPGSDLRFSALYLLAHDVKPCGWHLVEGREAEVRQGLRVERTLVASGPPRPTKGLEPPALRILYFHPLYASGVGSPRPERDPMLAVAAVTEAGETKEFLARGADDGRALREFAEFVNAYDPDVLVGFGSNRQHLPYLVQRCRVRGFRFAVGRGGGEPHPSLYGHMSVLGSANVDLLDFVEEIPEIKLKTLPEAARYFGVPEVEGPEELEGDVYHEGALSPERLREACRLKAQMVRGVSVALLDYALQLSNLVGMPLDQVGPAAVGFRVDWYLMRQALKLGELIPPRVEQPYQPYRGAVVLTPKPGLHENVAVLDFSAMYPNLMIQYNVSPDTYVKPDEPAGESDVHVAPEVGHRFRRTPPGFYARVLSELLHAREGILREMEGLDPSSVRFRVLRSRQKGVKTVANAVYGYCGWTGARWYVREVAEATAAWGRKAIQTALSLARECGLEVIYSDTDSIFVEHREEKIEKFLSGIEGEVGLKVRPEVIYRRILFTEAKKRYAGLTLDGRVDVVGLEVARGDWANIARKVQEKVLETILKEKSPGKAAEQVRQLIARVLAGGEPYREFIIWKTLSKPLDGYSVRAPHVEAARRLAAHGWKVSVGDTVGFVIVRGGGKLFEKATPYVLASPESLDLEYYVESQILPAALRILELFGLSREDIVSPKPQRTLADF